MKEYPQKQECTRCHQFKPLSKFSKHKDGKYGCISWCKECVNKYSRDRYNSKLEVREDQAKRHKAKREERNIWINKIKKVSGCTQCGFDKDIKRLGFHHLIEDDKNNEISNMMDRSSDDAIEKEIEKCIVLCKSCHMQLHQDGREYLKEGN